MASDAFTRARYPSVIPHDMPCAEPVTIQKPRTTLPFAQLAALEQRAGWEYDGRHINKHNAGQSASQETLDAWLSIIAALPSPFIALDAETAMVCTKSAAHSRLQILTEKGFVQKAQSRSRPQLWEVVKIMRDGVK